MPDFIYPNVTAEIAKQRREIVPGQYEAFHDFSKQVFAAGALDVKTKHLIAVATAHVTQCPYCIAGHTKAASRQVPAASKSWKRSGWLHRIARGPLSPTRRSRFAPWRKLKAPAKTEARYSFAAVRHNSYPCRRHPELRWGESPTFSNEPESRVALDVFRAGWSFTSRRITVTGAIV